MSLSPAVLASRAVRMSFKRMKWKQNSMNMDGEEEEEEEEENSLASYYSNDPRSKRRQLIGCWLRGKKELLK